MPVVDILVPNLSILSCWLLTSSELWVVFFLWLERPQTRRVWSKLSRGGKARRSEEELTHLRVE